MKHIVFFAFSFAMGLTCFSDNSGVLIFSDDFSEPAARREFRAGQSSGTANCRKSLSPKRK